MFICTYMYICTYIYMHLIGIDVDMYMVCAFIESTSLRRLVSSENLICIYKFTEIGKLKGKIEQPIRYVLRFFGQGR